MYVFALRAGKITIFEPNVVIFTVINTNIYKIRELHRAIFILQHLATNLCSFSHSKMLVLAVVLDFVLLALIKIQSIAGITHLLIFIYYTKYNSFQVLIPPGSIKERMREKVDNPFKVNNTISGFFQDFLVGPFLQSILLLLLLL